MNTMQKIVRVIASKMPGATLDAALAKRQIERELRAAGFSRSHAAAEAARIYRERGYV